MHQSISWLWTDISNAQCFCYKYMYCWLFYTKRSDFHFYIWMFAIFFYILIKNKDSVRVYDFLAVSHAWQEGCGVWEFSAPSGSVTENSRCSVYVWVYRYLEFLRAGRGSWCWRDLPITGPQNLWSWKF